MAIRPGKYNPLKPDIELFDYKSKKRYGLKLVPELFAHLNPMPFEAAVQMEQDLAEDLRRLGYTVTGGH